TGALASSVAAESPPLHACSVARQIALRHTGHVFRSDDAAAEKEQARLLRDILGNPFRPAVIEPAWLVRLDGAGPKLAQAAYEERLLPAGTLDPVRLAILADALEEAGCTDAEILNHCRGPGPHVRGCWLVDLILGKT